MNTKEDTRSASNSMFPRCRRRIGPARLTLLASLALALIVAARAEPPPPAIPFSDIGDRATANYKVDALGITATADGARLRCGFQKLEGRATREGLSLSSTSDDSQGESFRVIANAVGRQEGASVRASPDCLPFARDIGLAGTLALPEAGQVKVVDQSARFLRPGLTEE